MEGTDLVSLRIVLSAAGNLVTQHPEGVLCEHLRSAIDDMFQVPLLFTKWRTSESGNLILLEQIHDDEEEHARNTYYYEVSIFRFRQSAFPTSLIEIRSSNTTGCMLSRPDSI